MLICYANIICQFRYCITNIELKKNCVFIPLCLILTNYGKKYQIVSFTVGRRNIISLVIVIVKRQVIKGLNRYDCSLLAIFKEEHVLGRMNN